MSSSSPERIVHIACIQKKAINEKSKKKFYIQKTEILLSILVFFENSNMYKVSLIVLLLVPHNEPLSILVSGHAWYWKYFLLYEVVIYVNVRIIKQINCHHLDWTVQTLPCCDVLMDMMLCIECEILYDFMAIQELSPRGCCVLGEDFVWFVIWF